MEFQHLNFERKFVPKTQEFIFEMEASSFSESSEDDNYPSNEYQIIPDNLPPNQQVLAEFNEGYTTRSMVELQNGINMDGNFVFTRDKIIYYESDADCMVTLHIVINQDELPYYYYNSPEPFIVFGVTLKNLRAATQSIWKKDGVRIHLFEGDLNMYLQIISGGTKHLGAQNHYTILYKKVSTKCLNIEKYIRPDTDPNCKIPLGEFYKMCMNISRIGASLVTIIGYPRGVKFIAEAPNKIIKQNYRFGICPADQIVLSDQYAAPLQGVEQFLAGLRIGNDKHNNNRGDETQNRMELKCIIRGNVIKNLAKINNIASPFSVIKIHMEPNRPVKLTVHVGSYGVCFIYLNSLPEA